jgi:hypothetical protein
MHGAICSAPPPHHQTTVEREHLGTHLVGDDDARAEVEPQDSLCA